jgi:hypothetical protein
MIEIVIEARDATISKSMKVKRILPFRLRRMVGPFIFMDHAGPLANAPSDLSLLDVLPHPHIGLSTVSYLFGGRVTHRDSLGVKNLFHCPMINQDLPAALPDRSHFRKKILSSLSAVNNKIAGLLFQHIRSNS